MDQGELLYGVSIAELVRWCSVDRTTASRWKTCTSRAPGAALALVAFRVYGEAGPVLGESWMGWRVGRDELLYPPGYRRGYSAGEILALPFVYGELAALRLQLKEQADAPQSAAAIPLLAACA